MTRPVVSVNTCIQSQANLCESQGHGHGTRGDDLNNLSTFSGAIAVCKTFSNG
ncbi:hypothetical protein Prudu_018250 [Prunus dulcis]|uniref:Uncharacterized protein n=1 Tax=Prunus dulcis TaxID=3755 RepID=A0A4Y1RQC4_PRUDU|nr:hypothetical protein Prudu_018250 [Prunus dulcis]